MPRRFVHFLFFFSFVFFVCLFSQHPVGDATVKTTTMYECELGRGWERQPPTTTHTHNTNIPKTEQPATLKTARRPRTNPPQNWRLSASSTSHDLHSARCRCLLEVWLSKTTKKLLASVRRLWVCHCAWNVAHVFVIDTLSFLYVLHFQTVMFFLTPQRM